MIDLREFTVETVCRALQIEIPGANSSELRERAEALIAIAEANYVRIEALLDWIHSDAPGKEWSLAEFRAFCRVVTA